MGKIAVYPGSFDPVTYGHIDIIKRASRIFDKVVIAVAHNIGKSPLFSVEERVDMLKSVTRNMQRVNIDDFTGLAVDYVKTQSANVILRGLRMISDFEYEFQMALTNRKIEGKIETIFMMPSESYSYISSKLLKEAVSLGADISAFVPPIVKRALERKLR